MAPPEDLVDSAQAVFDRVTHRHQPGNNPDGDAALKAENVQPDPS